MFNKKKQIDLAINEGILEELDKVNNKTAELEYARLENIPITQELVDEVQEAQYKYEDRKGYYERARKSNN